MADEKAKYEAEVAETRAKRMKWWHEARFGMFVHWGLYAQLGRHEWVMNRERIPLAEYEKLADTWKPKPNAAEVSGSYRKAASFIWSLASACRRPSYCPLSMG